MHVAQAARAGRRLLYGNAIARRVARSEMHATAAAAHANGEADDGIVILAPVPESRYEEVLSHVTPIFLRDEPLSRCFPPDESGARADDFRDYARQQLRSGLCVAALAPAPAPAPAAGDADAPAQRHVVIAACLNRVLHRDKVLGVDLSDIDAQGGDPLNRSVVRLLTRVHQRLDLFGALALDELLEIGLISVDAAHTGKGLGTRVVRASVALGARCGLRAVKADCTGAASARCCGKAGLGQVLALPYERYRPHGDVVFGCTRPPDHQLRVYAARLHAAPPHATPLAEAETPRIEGDAW